MVTSGVRLLDGESAKFKSFSSERIAAFCGVGNPQSFFSQLRREGCVPVFTRAFADHHNYNQTELDALVQEARGHGAEALVTTAKDAIKVGSFDLELPCYVLEIQIAIDDETRFIELIRGAGNKFNV
jgi:tetraacyldisaccharide 4'-kinase